MRLIDLLAEVTYRTSASPAELEALDIQVVTEDSRQAAADVLFVAVRGVHTDGHKYVPSAIASGARAIVVETLPEELTPGVIYLQVENSAEALGELSAALNGYPTRQLTIVGVTGTNGKTTIATLLYRLFRLAGYRCGLLSTVCNYIEDEAVAATHTTPSAPELQSLLARMRDAGCTHVFMEVSSHAMAQHRVAGIRFAGGIFTNLTRDHLDYHGTVEAYLRAKKSFFDGLDKDAFALTNADDKNGFVMLQNTAARRLSYSLKAEADYRAKILERHLFGTEALIQGHEVMLRLVGDFNVYNLLAVYAAAVQLGIHQEQALLLLSQLTAVDGRFQSYVSPSRGYVAIVDYAHTPDALVNVLDTIHRLKKDGALVIAVVGCGGDRDRGKRPEMARESARRADYVILTSDNPRTEDPRAIIDEMRAGLSDEELGRTLSIVDRREAIRTASFIARSGDVILIAGKGHETYQEISGVRHHFDDREVVLDQMSHEG